MTTADLRLGRWQDVLAGVEVDALICDPPYSARTHEGQRTGSSIRMPTIGYSGITKDDADELAASWSIRTTKWAVIFSDHCGFQWHEDAWTKAGWLVFAPVVMVKNNPPPRFSGDGPCLAVEFIMVARRRKRMAKADMGSRDGAYHVDVGLEGGGRTVAGRKNLGLMSAIIRDYSRPGDLVCDPFSGSGTTAIAALQEGRRFVGSEAKPEHHAIAMRRIAKGYTPSMFSS